MGKKKHGSLKSLHQKFLSSFTISTGATQRCCCSLIHHLVVANLIALFRDSFFLFLHCQQYCAFQQFVFSNQTYFVLQLRRILHRISEHFYKVLQLNGSVNVHRRVLSVRIALVFRRRVFRLAQTKCWHRNQSMKCSVIPYAFFRRFHHYSHHSTTIDCDSETDRSVICNTYVTERNLFNRKYFKQN